ncbi:MAG: energy transducer TonB [Gemmatimonadota bacterium]
MSTHRPSLYPTTALTTANDRFKRSFASRLSGSIIVATVLHALIFALFPEMTAADVAHDPDVLEILETPPEVDIPDAPEPLTKPAVPVPTVDVPADVTIAPTVPDDGGFGEMPPPPDAPAAGPNDAPRLTPFTVRPEVKNRDRVARALLREYPPLLRDTGIGGRVVVWFFIDEGGQVQETRIHETFGQPSLDAAALDVAEVFEFSPALNRDEAVPVWIQLPIVFDTRSR